MKWAQTKGPAAIHFLWQTEKEKWYRIHFVHGSLKEHTVIFPLLHSLILLSDGDTPWDEGSQETPWTTLAEQPVQQGSPHNCAVLRSHTCCSSLPRWFWARPLIVVMPQTGIPLYDHQRCPSQLLPVSPSGSQLSFSSGSAWGILFQHETKGLLKKICLSSNICFIIYLKILASTITNPTSWWFDVVFREPFPDIHWSICYMSINPVLYYVSTSAKQKADLIFLLSVFGFSTAFLSCPFSPFVGVWVFTGGLVTCRSHLAALWCATAHATQCWSVRTQLSRGRSLSGSSASSECWKTHSTGVKWTKKIKRLSYKGLERTSTAKSFRKLEGSRNVWW